MMNNEFTTIFEVSYFSNGIVIFNLVFLVIGLYCWYCLIKGQWGSEKLEGMARLFLAFWTVGWTIFSVAWCSKTVSSAHNYMRIMQEKEYHVIEGIVEVLHKHQYGSHDGGDVIRIHDIEFQYNDSDGSFSYHRTISHKGKLKNGTYARLSYYEDRILKVEIKN